MNYSLLSEKFPDIFNNKDAVIRILLGHDEIDIWQKGKKAELKKRNLPEAWADIGVVFDDPYVIAIRDLVEFPGGYRNGYLRLFNRAYLEGGAAGVVILPEMNGKILLMWQFRHATRSWHWEIPRGFGEPGVTADSQAEREIQEEVQGKITQLIDLGIFFNNTGLEGHPVNLYIARMESIGEPDREEGIEKLQWVSVAELEKMIANEVITDGFTIAAYTRAKLKGLI